LDADLVNQMLSAQIRQMRSFFVICQTFADTIHHHHNEGAIIHVQPIGATDEFIGAVTCKWAVDILAQVRLVKLCHVAILTIRGLRIQPCQRWLERT
jgi:hypothetical protein